MNSMLKLSTLAAITLPIFLTACQEETFVVEPFQAKYFMEDDGREPGKGNDGSDPSIEPKLVFEETVTRPTIQYSWDDFHEIDSYNFYAEWTGKILINEPTPLAANFDVSWSNVEFYIDGELIEKWKNANKTIPLELATGEHDVLVKYHNHWHTTGFNMSFTNYEQITTEKDVSALITADAQINYLSVHEAKGLYNNVEVTIPETTYPQVLFLYTYAGVNWVINNPANTEIQAIFFNSYAPGSSIEIQSETPVFEVSDFRGDYNDMSVAIDVIFNMTGRAPDYTFGSYRIDSHEIENAFSAQE